METNKSHGSRKRFQLLRKKKRKEKKNSITRSICLSRGVTRGQLVPKQTRSVFQGRARLVSLDSDLAVRSNRTQTHTDHRQSHLICLFPQLSSEQRSPDVPVFLFFSSLTWAEVNGAGLKREQKWMDRQRQWDDYGKHEVRPWHAVMRSDENGLVRLQIS